MQPGRGQARAPGSFAPLPPISSNASNIDLSLSSLSTASSSSSRPRPRRGESASSDESFAAPALNLAKARSSPQQPFGSFTQLPSASTPSLQNFSRPTLVSGGSSSAAAAAAAARQVAASNNPSRSGSPLTLPEGRLRAHARKHSQTAGLFDSTLPSTSSSNLSQIGMAAQGGPPLHPHREMSASQAAAQAAVMHHQSQQQAAAAQQLQQQQLQHARQRSQTVPAPGEPYDNLPPSNKRGSGGPLSPPMLSLTEASAPRDHGFVQQGYHNGSMGNHQRTAAQAAANVVFPRSGQSSPGIPQQQIQIPTPPPLPPPLPEKKPEKSKVKLFSRPGKIGVKGEPKEKPLPSPSKIGSALASLQRANFSTTSLESSAQSFYNLGNSSSATIRATDTPPPEGKEKEKKHHFLSRQKHKLKDKDDFHLPLSSAASNSRPTDPNAPSSLYNFNLPPSPGPSTTFKSVSGLDLRHGGRALRERKREEAAESTTTLQTDYGPSTTLSSAAQSGYFNETIDTSKIGLSNMSMDDAWPLLKAKMLVVFQGEDLRLPVEDFNRIVMVHIQYCIQRRSPNIIIDDLRDLLSTGFASLDHALRLTPEDRLIPALVELWLFTFTSILPYMQSVFLPLDLEFQGAGPLLTPDKARDFWGGVVALPPSETPTSTTSSGSGSGSGSGSRQFANITPVSSMLDVRRLVLAAYRDTVIMPRYDKLKTMFSRLSLDFLPGSSSFSALNTAVGGIGIGIGTPGGGASGATSATTPGGGGGGGVGGSALSASPIPIPQGKSSHQDLFSTSPSVISDPSAPGAGGGPGSAASSSYPLRPGTAMSLDPSVASYNSTGTTLMGDIVVAAAATAGAGRPGSGSGSGNRSRAISNVSFGSGVSDPRPFTPGGGLGSGLLGRDHGGGGGAVDDGKAVTDMVGRMLQCMSVLASVGVAGSGADEGTRAVEELSRLLKLNWLGRGRTGRNRRGIVGGRIRRVGTELPVREEVSVG